MHLAYPASLQALHSIIRLQNSRVFFSKSVKILNNPKKQIIHIQHKRIKKAGGNQLAIYKHGRGFELRTTKNKSSKWPERDLNPGLPDCKSNTLTTQPCCLLNCPSTTPSCSDITKKRLNFIG